MNSLLRSLHALSVSLWFGSVAFFTIAGLLIFQSFQEKATPDIADREAWFPLPTLYSGESPGKGFPEPLRLEQGSRAAGVAVSPIFPVYYAMQTGCGVIALFTALILARSGEGCCHGWRIGIVSLALATALAGWWLEGEVSRLRVPRNELTDALLATQSPPASQVEAAREARANFGRWHGYSLLQNFATLLLAGGLTLLVPGLSRPASWR